MTAIHLATEITESQKVRSDLLKWKMIAVAVIASVGLGISSEMHKFERALGVIPFVMAYIDALCIHINLRIFAISKWHRTDKAKVLEKETEYRYMNEYENFIAKAHEAGAFDLERWTIFYSSLLINLLLMAAPLLELQDVISGCRFYLTAAGAFGLLVTVWLNVHMRSTKARIEQIQS